MVMLCASTEFLHIIYLNFEIFAVVGCYAGQIDIADVSGQPIGPIFKGLTGVPKLR
jgi:hypothetical protein